MVASIRTNLMAANTARMLGSHYDRLSKSVQRLSSGLRVNSAADDAAGLAIRELMRADVAVLNQGIRNANDAISMIQVADGALGIIDEKLIRMKELSEQAATGTYNSTQRLMIDSEFQAMADEIDRIANATDFNGVKLLDGSLAGAHNGQGLQSTGKMKIHFGTGNDSAEDYYYVGIDDCTTVGLGLKRKLEFPDAPAGIMWINDAKIDYTSRKIILEVKGAEAGSGSAAFVPGMDFYQLPDGLKNITITSNCSKPKPVHKPHVNLFLPDGTQVTGVPLPPDRTWDPAIDDNNPPTTVNESVNKWWNSQTESQILAEGKRQGIFDQKASYTEVDPDSMNAGYNKTFYKYTASEFTITSVTGINEIGASASNYNGKPTEEIYNIDKLTNGDDLVFFIGGHVNKKDGCNCYNLTIEADITDTFLQKLETWRGDKDFSREDGRLHIDTQQRAQEVLGAIDDAITRKDTIRASLGALQNRLENTVTNLSIQAENLQASESRISDTDVAKEMTEFVRNQILTQSATAMLSQANSLPQMLMTLVNG